MARESGQPFLDRWIEHCAYTLRSNRQSDGYSTDSPGKGARQEITLVYVLTTPDLVFMSGAWCDSWVGQSMDHPANGVGDTGHAVPFSHPDRPNAKSSLNLS